MVTRSTNAAIENARLGKVARKVARVGAIEADPGRHSLPIRFVHRWIGIRRPSAKTVQTRKQRLIASPMKTPSAHHWSTGFPPHRQHVSGNTDPEAPGCRVYHSTCVPLCRPSEFPSALLLTECGELMNPNG
jgi:hypothetical protein